MKICRTSLKINASQKTYLEISQKSMAHRRKSTGNPRTFREAREFSTCCYVCNDCGDNQHGDCWDRNVTAHPRHTRALGSRSGGELGEHCRPPHRRNHADAWKSKHFQWIKGRPSPPPHCPHNENQQKFKENRGTHREITEDQRNCMKICRKSLKINASQRKNLENSWNSIAQWRKSTENAKQSRRTIQFSTFC